MYFNRQPLVAFGNEEAKEPIPVSRILTAPDGRPIEVRQWLQTADLLDEKMQCRRCMFFLCYLFSLCLVSLTC